MGWGRFFRRRFWDEERSRELRAHVAIETDENIARGMPPEEALFAARRKFGNPTLMREEIYHMNSIHFVETLWRDVRYGLRMLVKSPGFTAVAVLTLALGIGANTAIFSVVNAVLLRPLPYREPARLVVLQSYRPRLHIENTPFSPADFVDYQTQNRSFEQLAAVREIKPNLTGKGVPAERIRAAVVTPNFFSMLGVSPSLGRAFLADDGVPGAPRVAILDNGFWQRHFGGAPGVLGSQITLNGSDVTVVGVLPAQFIATVEADVWLNPRSVVPEFLFSDSSDPRAVRATRYLNLVIGRLKPGVSLAQAQGDTESIAARLEHEYSLDEGFSVRVVGLRESLVAGLLLVLVVLLCVVGMVLLIACANVANLLLARAASRQREVSVRLALGAGRWRIARQLLTESLMLALCGGLLGVLLAAGGTRLFSAMQANFLPRTAVVQLDTPALLFTLGITAITGILFGLAPAIQNSHLSLSSVMGESGRGNSSGLRQGRLRSLLAAAQIAMSLVLLIAAGLLTRSFVSLLDVRPGFDPNHLVTMAINLTSARYAQQDEQRQFVNQLLARLQALPGVEGVGLSSDLPLERTDITTEAGSIEGQTLPPGERFVVGVHPVNADYFRAMGVPLLRGRAFSAADVSKSRPVIILNQRSAEKLWPGQNAIGKHIQLEGNQAEVVGVVGNILHNGLTAGASFESYLPYDQFPWSFLVLAVRTRADSGAMVAGARNAVSDLDPSLPVYNVRPMPQVLEATLASRMLTMNLIGTFAVLALVLAMVGIYGVMSYAVTQRAHELGVRIALGASPGDVLRMVLGKGLRLAAAGMAVGLVASFAATRLLRSLLFSVTSTDPATFTAVTVLLTTVVVLACYLPARRASRVDPIVTLRYD